MYASLTSYRKCITLLCFNQNRCSELTLSISRATSYINTLLSLGYTLEILRIRFSSVNLLYIFPLLSNLSVICNQIRPAFKREGVKTCCLRSDWWDSMLIVSSDPCLHTVCYGSSQLSMKWDYNYKGKGHFSCSQRHHNELVVTCLTLVSSAQHKSRHSTHSTFHFACKCDQTG